MESQSKSGSSSDTQNGRPKNKFLSFLINNWFILATITGVGIGFGIAFVIRATHPSDTVLTWIAMPGDIYLRILTLTILPLIVANVFVVMATLEPKKNGAISIFAVAYIICTNLVGSGLGAACAAIIQPGSYVLNRAELPNKTISGSGLTASDIFKDIVYNLFPENIMGITIFQYRTEVVNTTTLVKYGNSNKPGTNMIGIMFCAFVFGAAANAIGPTARPLVTFFNSVAATVTKVMNVFLLFTPVGVCFMVTSSVIDRTNIESDFIQLGIFVATVNVAILIHLILHVLVLSVVSRRNPLRLFKYSFNSFLITFATTSTVASMGEMYIELDRYGCNKLASRFVLPVCLVIKGDGPAIFISAACMFVVQQTGFEIDSSKVIFIVLLTFGATLAVPNIPSSSMVIVVTILSSIGVPGQIASILYAMEWILDRCRSGFSGLSVMFIAASTSAFFERHCDKIDDSGLEHPTGGNDGNSNCGISTPENV